MDYKERRAAGAGITFVIFKDVYTTNKTVKNFKAERKNKLFDRFFSLTELQLEWRRWRVERAPLTSDIYWSHLELSKLSLGLRRGAVNTCILIMLLFCSSSLTLISVMKSSDWFATVVLQFFPNVLLFVSMYIIIPSVLSYLSKSEKHLIVSREQRAAMLKIVYFFLVNLIVLRALVELSLESVILGMGRCYLDGKDCKRIEQYMSVSSAIKIVSFYSCIPYNEYFLRDIV